MTGRIAYYRKMVTAEGADQNQVQERPLEPKKLFVRNLPYKTFEKDVRIFFEGTGELEEVRVISLRNGYRTNRCAFVTFSNDEDAAKAMEEKNGKDFNGRTVRVVNAQVERKREECDAQAPDEKPTQRRRSNGMRGRRSIRRRQRGPPENSVESNEILYVAGLNVTIENNELLELFKQFNPIKATVIYRKLNKPFLEILEKRGEKPYSRGYGFVTFDSQENQEKAMEAFNDQEYKGRKLILKKAMIQQDKDEEGKEDLEVEQE